jgi:hypothetical protein
MADIIPFRPRSVPEADPCEVDLLTAIDVAIRDLADITRNWGTEGARRQAEDCRAILMQAYYQACMD